ncbi:MAG TPA: hypothetical protein DD861_13565 [Erythrobacter sp.]|nr:hypothetical protein [Erythrobacter sp.]
MHQQGEEVHVTDTEASGGSKEGVVRWVLAGGLLLAILLLSVTWIVPALSTGDVEEEGTVSGQISSMEGEGDDTDSIVTDLGDDQVTAPGDQVTTEDGLEVVEN